MRWLKYNIKVIVNKSFFFVIIQHVLHSVRLRRRMEISQETKSRFLKFMESSNYDCDHFPDKMIFSNNRNDLSVEFNTNNGIVYIHHDDDDMEYGHIHDGDIVDVLEEIFTATDDFAYSFDNLIQTGSRFFVTTNYPFSMMIEAKSNREFYIWDASSLAEIMKFDVKPSFKFKLPQNMTLDYAIKNEIFRYNQNVEPAYKVGSTHTKEAEVHIPKASPPAPVGVVIDEANSGQVILHAAKHGVKLALADQAAEMVLNIGLHFFAPMLKEFLSNDAREILKFFFAILFHYIFDNMSFVVDQFGEEKVSFIKNACVLVMQASTHNIIRPKLSQLRSKIMSLSQLDADVIRKEAVEFVSEVETSEAVKAYA